MSSKVLPHAQSNKIEPTFLGGATITVFLERKTSGFREDEDMPDEGDWSPGLLT
jgi:hypothetical protein